MDETTAPLQLIVRLDCGSARDAVLDALRPCVAASREEAGCLAYAPFVDGEDAGRLFMLETWRDEAALAAHEITAHFQALVARLEHVVPGGLPGIATIHRTRQAV